MGKLNGAEPDHHQEASSAIVQRQNRGRGGWRHGGGVRGGVVLRPLRRRQLDRPCCLQSPRRTLPEGHSPPSPPQDDEEGPLACGVVGREAELRVGRNGGVYKGV